MQTRLFILSKVPLTLRGTGTAEPREEKEESKHCFFNNVDGWWPKRQWSWGSPPNVTMQTEKPPKDNCPSTGMFKRPLQHSWQWIVSSRSGVMAETIKQNYTTALDFVGSIPVSSSNNRQHFLHQMENNSTQHTINKWFYIVSAK